MMKKMICGIVVLVMMFAMAACGGNPAPTDPPDQIKEPGLTLVVGKTMTLEAAGEQVTWESSDPARATVDENGTVKALSGRGTVTITAAAADKTESWDIALCEETQFGAVPLASSDEKLTIGVWNGSYHAFDDFRMDLMHQAGISLIVGIDPQWVVSSTMTELLDLAQEYGVSLITDLRSWDGQTVPEYAQHPALMGFLMYDEPGTPAYAKLAQLKASFDAVMPEDKLFYVNLFGSSCGYESLYGNDYDPLHVNYEKDYLKPFIETVEPEVLSYDAYGLQEGGLIRSRYLRNFDILSHNAQQNDLPFWYTMLSSAHDATDGRYVVPTDKELRWQSAMAITYGAEVLLHYIMTSHETDDYVCMLDYSSKSPTEIYDDVALVNQEFLAWQDIYRSYEWVGTVKVDVGKENLLLSDFEYDIPFKNAGILTGVKSDQDMLVGVFQNNGQNAYMITNAGDTTDTDLWMRLNFTMNDANVKLQLAPGSYQCAAVINRGQISYVPVNADNTVDITVSAYDGAFVIPVAS